MVRQNWISRVFFIACIAIFFVYGSAPLFLPKPAPVSVPNDQFSAERALQSVRVLAQSPRVTGTQGMERAVSYLVEDLRAATIQSACSMGLDAQFGSIRTGKTADLVVPDGDPLQDFHLVGKPVQALFMDGNLVINRCGLEVTNPRKKVSQD